MLKEMEMQGYMQRLQECKRQGWNAERYTRKQRMQRVGWERTLCKAGAGLLIVLLEIACIERL